MSKHPTWDEVVAEVIERCSMPHNFITPKEHCGLQRQLDGMRWEGGTLQDMVNSIQNSRAVDRDSALDVLRSFERPDGITDTCELAAIVMMQIEARTTFRWSSPGKGYMLVIEALRQYALADDETCDDGDDGVV